MQSKTMSSTIQMGLALAESSVARKPGARGMSGLESSGACRQCQVSLITSLIRNCIHATVARLDSCPTYWTREDFAS
jgi:hypothetical protein